MDFPYQCLGLGAGEVSIDRSMANPTSAVFVYGDQRWPGTLSGRSITFFSPISRTPDSQSVLG